MYVELYVFAINATNRKLLVTLSFLSSYGLWNIPLILEFFFKKINLLLKLTFERKIDGSKIVFRIGRIFRKT